MKFFHLNSLEQIIKAITLRFVQEAKNNNVLPTQALRKIGIEVHSSIPNRWEAFELESHCSISSIKDEENE